MPNSLISIPVLLLKERRRSGRRASHIAAKKFKETLGLGKKAQSEKRTRDARRDTKISASLASTQSASSTESVYSPIHRLRMFSSHCSYSHSTNDYAEALSSSDNNSRSIVGSDGELRSGDIRSIDASEGFGFDFIEESSSSDSRSASDPDMESSSRLTRRCVMTESEVRQFRARHGIPIAYRVTESEERRLDRSYRRRKRLVNSTGRMILSRKSRCRIEMASPNSRSASPLRAAKLDFTPFVGLPTTPMNKYEYHAPVVAGYAAASGRIDSVSLTVNRIRATDQLKEGEI